MTRFGRDGATWVSFPALGTTVMLVVADPSALRAAVRVLESAIDAVDRACSRFRDDSELTAVNRAAGQPVAVSPTLLDALDTALRTAAETDGIVDPTIGRALRILGYDRDFRTLDEDGPVPSLRCEAVPGWHAVHLDRTAGRVTVPAGVELDLGATAKAWCADRAATAVTAATGSGVLVGLGGDIAVAGAAPDDGWVVQIADRHDDPIEPHRPIVTIWSGGLATSSTTRRRWRRGGVELHHIIDPATGQPAGHCWRTVSVAAATCVGANAAATAAVVLGPRAPAWLSARNLPARLVSEDGDVTTVAGWPADQPAAAGAPS